MVMNDELGGAPVSGLPVQLPVVRLAAAGFLARYEGATHRAYDSDLRTWFAWCSRQGVDPLVVTRPMVELYVRWMTETAGYAPATTARRLGTVCGFYRFLVIDGIVASSPAEYVRRPRRPEESPTLGLTHLQFEALLAASRAAGPTAQVLILLLGMLGYGCPRRAPSTSATWAWNTGIGSCSSTARAAPGR
jgi:integrase/recombinase XerD